MYEGSRLRKRSREDIHNLRKKLFCPESRLTFVSSEVIFTPAVNKKQDYLTRV